jgi:CDP-diacylglycerol--serine O-phosphatidyltransferase
VGIIIVSAVYSVFISNIIILPNRSDLELIKLRDLIKLPDYITFGNVVAGLFSIVFSINKNYTLALWMMLLSVVLDVIDGKVARAIKREGNFGKELDSLADTVSFGVAPAVFGFSIINTLFGNIAFTVFLLCGLIRLARFNITSLNGEFQGMPITLNGLIIPIMYFAGLPLIYFPYLFILLGLLMVSSFRIKKL